jgi:hypothetical protein
MLKLKIPNTMVFFETVKEAINFNGFIGIFGSLNLISVSSIIFIFFDRIFLIFDEFNSFLLHLKTKNPISSLLNSSLFSSTVLLLLFVLIGFIKKLNVKESLFSIISLKFLLSEIKLFELFKTLLSDSENFKGDKDLKFSFNSNSILVNEN